MREKFRGHENQPQGYLGRGQSRTQSSCPISQTLLIHPVRPIGRYGIFVVQLPEFNPDWAKMQSWNGTLMQIYLSRPGGNPPITALF
jgi:hypothetical protein